MSKSIKLVVVSALVFSMIFAVIFAAKAQEDERSIYYNDEYIYEIVDNSYVTIHFYTGVETDVVVPQYIHSLPVKIIESLAFCDTDITSVEVPTGVETLKSEAFIYAGELESVKLPSSLEYMGEGLFRGCEKLKSVTFGDCKAPLGSYMFYGCTALEEVILPQSTDEISAGLFAYCKSLRQIELPERTKSIGDYSFYSSGLEEIEMPESVKSIGDRGFANCSSLRVILCPNLRELEIGFKAFENIGMEIPDDFFGEETSTDPQETTEPYLPPPFDNPDVSGTIDEVPDPPEPPVVATTSAFVQIDSYYFGDFERYILCENNKSAESKDTSERTKAELLSLAWNVRLAGDANCDGSVNIKDATAVQLYVASINTDILSLKNADVNRDGTLSIRDATVIRKFLAHLIEKFY